jgi:NADH-quinone oxidoreductase subunit B
MFQNYAIVQGVDQIVPVDVYAPGCPPNPETLMHAILTLHAKIASGDITRHREATGRGAELHVEPQMPTVGGPTGTTPVRISSR